LIIGETPYLGASPDGILINESGKIVGLLEIKCPFSAAKLTVSEACEQLDKFYIHKNNDGCSLDSSHTYYYQVQGSMAISNVKFTDFVVWTPSSLEIINVKYDPAIWTEEMLPSLKKFYTLYMLPAIYIKFDIKDHCTSYLLYYCIYKNSMYYKRVALTYKRREKISQYTTNKEI